MARQSGCEPYRDCIGDGFHPCGVGRLACLFAVALASVDGQVQCSNVVGAVVDSVIFPMLAFGAFPPALIALQSAAKVGGGAIWSVLLRPLVPDELGNMKPGQAARAGKV